MPVRLGLSDPATPLSQEQWLILVSSAITEEMQPGSLSAVNVQRGWGKVMDFMSEAAKWE